MINYWFGFLKYKFRIDLFCLELLIRLRFVFFKIKINYVNKILYWLDLM